MDTCKCGREIVQPATGRRRRMCETCSPTKARNRIVPLPPPKAQPDDGVASLAQVVRQSIVDAGRDKTPDGAAAIFAADMLMAGGATAAAAAALLKEMRAAAAEALKGAEKSGSIVDELKKRRAGRHAG